MDHTPARPPNRRPDRPRTAEGWARWSIPGLALALGLAPAGFVPAGEPPAPGDGRPPRALVASAPAEADGIRHILDASPARGQAAHPATTDSDSIARARRMIAECRARYRSVSDYTCTFFKRERLDGKVYAMHVMQMKARTNPASLYFKFLQPSAGREAIYVHGKHGNRILAHEVGVGRVVAGTVKLDPKGGRAMEANRHPVTEAGIGSLIDTVHDRWALELTPEDAHVVFHHGARVGDRACIMIETTHSRPGPQFLFHKVKLYIDEEHGLPIRFEAFDWPSKPGQEPPLMEEYTYVNLKINVGLKDRDFDPGNPLYSFGRF